MFEVKEKDKNKTLSQQNAFIVAQFAYSLFTGPKVLTEWNILLRPVRLCMCEIFFPFFLSSHFVYQS